MNLAALTHSKTETKRKALAQKNSGSGVFCCVIITQWNTSDMNVHMYTFALSCTAYD